MSDHGAITSIGMKLSGSLVAFSDANIEASLGLLPGN